MQLKKGRFAMGVIVAATAGGVAGLFVAFRKRNHAATAIIRQLTAQLDMYVTGLQTFVDNDHPDETAAQQFAGINKSLRVGTSPWDIHSEADPNDPGIYKVFISGEPKLLAHLRWCLRFARLLPVEHAFINTENGGASLGIHLRVTNPLLVESACLKLDKK